MKVLIISDIHGSGYYAEKIKEMLTANGFLIRVKAAGGKHNKAYDSAFMP